VRVPSSPRRERSRPGSSLTPSRSGRNPARACPWSVGYVPAFLFTQANNLDAQFGNGATKAWPACRVRDRVGQRTEVVDRIVRLVERRGEWRRVLPDQEALDVIRVDLDDYVAPPQDLWVHQRHSNSGP